MNKGIWLDHKNAYVVTIADKSLKVEKIRSGAESKFHVTGGSRSKSPYGPQDVVSEHKVEERRKHQLRSFYKSLVNLCRNTGRLYILGPDGAKGELQKELVHEKVFSEGDIDIETTDKITKNQIVAKVKEHFST